MESALYFHDSTVYFRVMQKYLYPQSYQVKYSYRLTSENPLTGDAPTGRQPDAHPRYDIHEVFELGMVFKGRMRRFWGPVERDIEPGDIWLCAAFEPHGYQIIDGPCDLVFTVFNPRVLQSFGRLVRPSFDWFHPFRIPADERPTIPPEHRPRMIELGQRLGKLLLRSDTVSRLRAQLVLLDILLDVMETRPSAVPSEKDTEKDTPILKAVQQVQNSHRMITTQEMADALELSLDQFSRRFAREMQISFAKFGLRCRLNGVANDLSHTDHPIKAVASDWDFANESHLYRVFRKEFGCTPATYRRQHRR